MSNCEAEKQAAEDAYQAYATALDAHYEACQTVPRDEQDIIDTAAAAATCYQTWLAARAVCIDCQNQNQTPPGGSP